MIIGQGLMARAFSARYAHDSEVAIFASGVSNSATTDQTAFARERALLAALLNRDLRVVYFGSCGSATGDAGAETPYMRHKRAMERLVIQDGKGLVLRLPQVVGRTHNPNTLTNFLHERILSGTPFRVWANAERNLIDVDHVAAIGARLIDAAPDSGGVLSIASAHSVPMPAVVAIFERVLSRKARYTTDFLGSALHIDAPEAAAAAQALGIDLGGNYTESLIRKYYEPST